MSMLMVNQDKCNSCGICVVECPVGIIEIMDSEEYPVWIEGGEERCIKCGHCVAVCPLAAIGIETMMPQDCALVRKELLLSPEQAEHFLKTRRSIRTYKQEPVPRETLEKLIDIASYAASGHNTQPLSWLIIEDSQEVRRLAGMVVDWMRVAMKEMPGLADFLHFDSIVNDWDQGRDRIMRSAPHAIVVHAPADDMMAPGDAPIALTYLEIASYGLGLGACWAGFLMLGATFSTPVLEALQLPEGHKYMGALMVGYPQYKYSRIPLKNKPSIVWR
jgi:nitroreductase/NAD-dependent dihydropyrimidine dehydrogenase PreA subunit